MLDYLRHSPCVIEKAYHNFSEVNGGIPTYHLIFQIFRCSEKYKERHDCQLDNRAVP